MEDQLIDTWLIHNRINLYLLNAIPDAALQSALSQKGRSVSKLFSHIHDVRLMWLKAAAPELLEALSKIENVDDGPELKPSLASALEASGAAIEALLRKSLASGGRVKNFKPHIVGFVGYLISHESHHRGQIGWALKFSGHPLDKKTAFGLWEWGTR